jgi:hypothetical protein
MEQKLDLSSTLPRLIQAIIAININFGSSTYVLRYYAYLQTLWQSAWWIRVGIYRSRFEILWGSACYCGSNNKATLAGRLGPETNSRLGLFLATPPYYLNREVLWRLAENIFLGTWTLYARGKNPRQQDL